MISALSSGISGMNAMQSLVDSHGGEIARASATMMSASSPSSIVNLSGNQPAADTDDLASNIVGMNESVLLYKANASTVKAADEALGTLLNMTA